MNGHRENLTTFRWDDDLDARVVQRTAEVNAERPTFPISVTLIALNSLPSSSTTATLLTPSPLINDIASNTVDAGVTATTDE